MQLDSNSSSNMENAIDRKLCLLTQVCCWGKGFVKDEATIALPFEFSISRKILLVVVI